MANELSFDYGTGFTLYATRFQPGGNVFISDGSSDEVWATADLYDVAMTENGVGGHYVGDFDASGNIGEGTYQVAIFLQAGGSPANSDSAIGRGEMYWDGENEISIFTLDTNIDILLASASKVLNVFGPGE